MPKRRSKTKIPNKIGLIFAAVLLLLFIVLCVSIINTGLLPTKHLAFLLIGGLIAFALCAGLQFIRSKPVNIIGMVLAAILSIACCFGLYYVSAANNLIKNVSGLDVKTNNMLVVVRKDDPAQILTEAADYQFGTQAMLDQENNQLMVDHVGQTLNKEIARQEFGSIKELGEALINNQIGAAIYNEAYAESLNELISGYSGQVRILYEHQIDTQLEKSADASTERPFNVYISGIDVSGPISTNSRSDVNLLMSVNPQTKKITLINTPRDTFVPIPGVSGEARDKLTHAGIYGVDVSMATLEQLYETKIDYYVRVNFDSLIEVIDAIGGITVVSDQAFTTTHGSYNIVVGENEMDGEKALGFVRERYNLADGDRDRGRNQQKVMEAIIQKVLSPEIIGNFSAFMNTLGDSVQTNMSNAEIVTFVKGQLADPRAYTIQFDDLKGRGDMQQTYSMPGMNLYVMWPDEASLAENKAMINATLSGQ